jgi:hypothetical protein
VKSAAQRKAEQRARAREKKFCIVNPAHGRAQPGKTMCAPCQLATFERVKASRATKRRTALLGAGEAADGGKPLP